MAILEKEVRTVISGNAKHYESLGYKIPRKINKQGKLIIPNGTEILVKIEDLSRNSNIKVTKICDDCGKKITNQIYNAILKCRENGDGKDRCFKCGRTYSGTVQKKNVKYENTLECWAKENNKEYLLEEFSNKNTKLPNEISRGSHEIVWWKCPNCKSEYDMKISDRTHQEYNCPYCSNQRVNHTNCIWTTYPEVASLLADPQRGYEITAFRNKKEWFTCPECGYEQRKCVGSVTFQGFSCSKCSDGLYYPEKFMMNFLSQLELYFETQNIFEWSKGIFHLRPEYKILNGKKKYDFYIPSLNMIIETHGGQHYVTSFETLGGKSQDEERENDNLKHLLALNNGIIYYIIIDCRKSDLEWIKNSILKSKLNKLFDLEKIDWLQCHEFACNTLVKTVCNLWNDEIKNTSEIGNIMKLSRPTVIRYLKQGAKIGWCDYDPKEEIKKRSAKAGSKNKISVIQLTLNEEFIKEWESMSEVFRKLNISATYISRCCKGKQKTACGFKWVYKEDYKNTK